ncbi:hypothetical protein [Ralstonia solanacearum]|nr:hypothetical protein [Ralstonia solanacearum]
MTHSPVPCPRGNAPSLRTVFGNAPCTRSAHAIRPAGAAIVERIRPPTP